MEREEGPSERSNQTTSGNSLLSIHNNIDTMNDTPSNGSCESNDDSSNQQDENINNQRQGTMTSALFNMLSTMIGGGSLSLPLAFHQAGNGLLAPILMICFAALIEYSIYFLVQAGNFTMKNDNYTLQARNMKGTLSFESVSSKALGPKARYLSMTLVFSICLFAITGNGVLLRDILRPISDYVQQQQNGNNDTDTINDGRPTLIQNASMIIVVLIITPLCTLENLSTLQNICRTSMLSIFILFCCITYRSVQCNFSSKYDTIRHENWWEYISLLPPHDETTSTSTLRQLASSLPIILGGFTCHFNVLTVHNELQDPSPKRVNRIFATSIWITAIFYTCIGFAGSMYGNCVESGQVEGNVLLNFDEDDVLILVGSAFLSLTIAFALPMFVAPARDMVLRALDDYYETNQQRKEGEEEANNGNLDWIVDSAGVENDDDSDKGNATLPQFMNNTPPRDINEYVDPFEGSIDIDNRNITEPLLAGSAEDMNEEHNVKLKSSSKVKRIFVSITILWTGSAVACCVKSVDTVWDILGSSISVMICFIIPCAAYLCTSPNGEATASEELASEEDSYSMVTLLNTRDFWHRIISRIIARIIIMLSVPFMLVCTFNAIRNAIFEN